MPQTIGSFYPRLQIYYVPHIRCAGNPPVEVLRTILPLPSVRLLHPRHIDAVQLVVTLTGPPGTLSLREEIPRSFDRWRPLLRFSRNTNRLVDVNEIGVCNVVVGSKLRPGCVEPGSYVS